MRAHSGVSAFRSCWAMNFFTASMATAWSMVPRVQASSQRRLQMRPQTAGKGFSFLISASASRVAALGGHLQVALHGNVGRTGRLAGGRAGVVAVDAVVVAVVDRPTSRGPTSRRRAVPAAGSRPAPFLGAQLLAQLDRTGGAVLHTAAAGYAVFRFATLAT